MTSRTEAVSLPYWKAGDIDLQRYLDDVIDFGMQGSSDDESELRIFADGDSSGVEDVG